MKFKIPPLFLFLAFFFADNVNSAVKAEGNLSGNFAGFVTADLSSGKDLNVEAGGAINALAVHAGHSRKVKVKVKDKAFQGRLESPPGVFRFRVRFFFDEFAGERKPG